MLRLYTARVLDTDKRTEVGTVKGHLIYSSGSIGLANQNVLGAQRVAQFILARGQELDSRWRALMFLEVEGKRFNIVSVVPSPLSNPGHSAYFDLTGGSNA